MRIIDQDLVVHIVIFCLKKSWKNALHQWRNPRPSQGSFLWLSDLFASGYIISVFDISVKHKFNTFCYQNFSTLIVKAYFCSSSCLLFFSRRYERAVLFIITLLYAVKTPYRQTLNKNLSNRFTRLQESYTTHGNTIIWHIHLVPEIKRFQSASSHPQNINMSRVISVVYDPRLFLACVETSMNKYRRNSFPSQIAHNSFGTLPPFCMF